MIAPAHIYYIWYGNWSSALAGSNPKGILTDFAMNLGNSPRYNTNTTYGDPSGNVSANAIFVADTVDAGTSLSLTDANIATIVSNALTTAKLPTDPAGVYFVLTAPGVAATSGFLSQYCGWHTYQTVNGTVIKYSFVGNGAGPGLGGCAAQVAASPNGNPGVDGMVSVIMHELEEAVTDPQFTGWYDDAGNENSDKCAWKFGTTYSAPGGGVANMKLGGRDFLVQQNWVNASGGYCATSYSATTPSLVSMSPTSGKQGTVAAVTLTGTNFVSGATVAVGGTGVSVSQVTVVNASTITANFTLASGATLGARTVAVTTSGGTTGTVNFTVNAATPSLVSMSPTSGQKGTAAAVTLTGTNFVSGATVAVSGTGVSVSRVTVVNASTITANFTLASGATLGARTVAVTTSGGTTRTVNFTVR